MKDKYEDLLSDMLSLPLPATYKILFNFFEQLDVNINLLKFRRQASTFTNLKKAIETSMGRQFTQESF
jgi:hypothetical protein